MNSPANPTDRVLPVDHLRELVAWCRDRGALLITDECYPKCGLGAGGRPVRVLHGDVGGGSTRACSLCTPSPSAPTSRATAAGSSPAIPP